METRKQEWNDFIEQSYEYPPELDGVESRLKARLSKNHKKRSAVFGSLSAVAAAFIFVLLVNTNAAFASSVSGLPLIGDLAEFVKFDKGLSKAIKNDYAQEVDLIAWDGDKQLALPYVIADEKNLVLFFRLPEDFKLKPDQYALISLKEMENGITGEKIEESYSSSSLSSEESEKDTGFLQQNYTFTKGSLPRSIRLTVDLELEETGDSQDAQPDEEEQADSTATNVRIVGTFTFQLHFKELAKPVIHEFHQDYTILGQKMTLEEMKEYPAGTEITFAFPDRNSAWVKGLDLAIEQNGKLISKVRGGMSGMSDDKKMSVFVESNYFDKPGAQELLIRGARLLDKKQEYITVDLDKKTITPAIPGMSVKEVKKWKDGKAELIFSTAGVSNNDGFSMFGMDYRDTAGNSYVLHSEGVTTMDSVMESNITVEYPADGKLIFQRSLTPMQHLEKPVRIRIPQ